jgi:ribosomal protein S12 methylthiotransferase accessory factor
MTTDNPPRYSTPSLSDCQPRDGEIRFSPNFSVYVLPPDGVCLYAENRKVFLRGELYCAVASRIGAGECRKSIIGALSADFPVAKIEEALKRLLDRRFVVLANSLNESAMAPGRLYDVPVGLGLRRRPLRERELNSLDPPTR